MNITPQNIAVLGAGAWGTAVAKLLAENGHNVTLWCYEQEVVHIINQTNINSQYLPNVLLPKNIIATTNINEAVGKSDYIFEAIPVKYLRSTCAMLDKNKAINKIWVVLSKGIEDSTLFVPSPILQDCFDNSIKYAVVSGPNFAAEICQKALTGTLVASPKADIAKQVRSLLHNEWFRTYPSYDPIGVQIAGAFKNIIALGIGIVHGAGQTSHNTHSYFLTRGLDEMSELISHSGGEKETAYSLAGVGDLVLTCTGTLSKNLRAGIMLGKGNTRAHIEEKMHLLPEGFNTIQALLAPIKKNKLDMPLTIGIYQCIYENAAPSTLLDL